MARTTSDKAQAAFRRLDHFFGSPSAQKRGFRSEDEAANSAATLLAAQMRMTYGAALKLVHEWYRREGGVAESRHYPKPQPPPRRFVSPTVADFNTLDDLVAHARQEGATHVLHVDDEVHLYFLRRDGQYEKAEVWQKDGYWHTQGPGSRVIVRRPPSNAQAIGGGRRVAEATGRLTPRQIQDFKNGFAEGYREGKHGETNVDGRPASPEAAEGIRRGLAAGARYRPGDNSAKVMNDATAAWIESTGHSGVREAPRGGIRSAHHHPARSRKPQ